MTIGEKHYILAIDPGTTHSAWVVTDLVDGVPVPVSFAKEPNEVVSHMLKQLVLANVQFEAVVIEKVVSYGQSVGQDVFTTCEWIGRYMELLEGAYEVYKLSRRVVKEVLSDNQAKTDSQIKQIICDRLVPGASNHGKGSKKEPTMFYGFKADVWQAYAVALTAHDIDEPTKLLDYTLKWG